ncbi:cytoplasmic dynein heavy chain, putative, partial [Ixodes scapularis]
GSLPETEPKSIHEPWAPSCFELYLWCWVQPFLNVSLQESVEVSLSALAGPSPPVVETVDVLRSADLILPWLSSGVEPLLVVGPEGCGKRWGPKLSRFAFSRGIFPRMQSETAAVKISTRNETKQWSFQITPIRRASRGRRRCIHIALRIHLAWMDKRVTSHARAGAPEWMVSASLVVSYRGFYDQDLDWVGLERIQIVATMSSGSSLGKHRLSTRFTSLARILALQYPEKEQLVRVYSAYLRPVMVHLAGKPSDWSSPPKLDTLAASMVLLLEQMQSKFSVDDQSHYVFTPKTLTEWTRGLLRYSTAGSPSVLEPWVYEGCRLLRDRLADDEARARFDAILSGILRSDWGDSSALEQARADVQHAVARRAAYSLRPKVCLSPPWNVSFMKTHTFLSFFLSGCFYVSQGGAFSSHASELGRSLSRLERSDWEGIVRKAVSTYGEPLPLRILRWTFFSIYGRPIIFVQIFKKKIGLYSKNFGTSVDPQIVQASGIENQQMLLLLEDHQLSDPESLEIVNGLLATGEVPGLFRQEELEPLLAPLRDQAAEEGYRGSALSYFCHR